MSNVGESSAHDIVARERQKSLVLRAWILGGLFFMALPGTLLGFSNLMAISTHHGLGSLPAAWMEGHGHAQVFGWIGSFILGIGFYSQPTRDRSPIKIPLACFTLWTTGVALRWLANIYAWHWRLLFPVSAGFELIAVLLFLSAASHHKLPESAQGKRAKSEMEPWMVSVLLGTAALTAVVFFNFVECLRLAVRGTVLSFPHALDQKYLVLMGWGFLVPVVWGFSARWLPAFLAIAKPDVVKLHWALALDLLGVLCGVSGWSGAAAILLACSAIVIGFALHLTQRPHGQAKVQGIHPSFPSFIRTAYAWLVVSRLHGHLGGLYGSTWRNLGRIAPCSDGRFRRDHGLLDRATHPPPLCRCSRHLQQAPDVSQLAADTDGLPAARLLRAAGLRRHPSVRVEGAAHLRHLGT